eukprot:GHVU01200234.1.p2 GENE.GHVU01200234.1~~GHVU01200234.1.p2  ORF type:complete len:490 (+),score=90.83 GHVU01200234.1:4122-5591(+)
MQRGGGGAVDTGATRVPEVATEEECTDVSSSNPDSTRLCKGIVDHSLRSDTLGANSEDTAEDAARRVPVVGCHPSSGSTATAAAAAAACDAHAIAQDVVMVGSDSDSRAPITSGCGRSGHDDARAAASREGELPAAVKSSPVIHDRHQWQRDWQQLVRRAHFAATAVRPLVNELNDDRMPVAVRSEEGTFDAAAMQIALSLVHSYTNCLSECGPLDRSAVVAERVDDHATLLSGCALAAAVKALGGAHRSSSSSEQRTAANQMQARVLGLLLTRSPSLSLSRCLAACMGRELMMQSSRGGGLSSSLSARGDPRVPVTTQVIVNDHHGVTKCCDEGCAACEGCCDASCSHSRTPTQHHLSCLEPSEADLPGGAVMAEGDEEEEGEKEEGEKEEWPDEYDCSSGAVEAVRERSRSPGGWMLRGGGCGVKDATKDSSDCGDSSDGRSYGNSSRRSSGISVASTTDASVKAAAIGSRAKAGGRPSDCGDALCD